MPRSPGTSAQLVAVAVASEARESGVSQLPPGEDIEAAVAAAMWAPDYPELGPPADS
jgi:malic enzyme